MLPQHLTGLCNLYTGQLEFSYDFGSNSSAVWGFLSIHIFLLFLCTTPSLISPCVYIPGS